MIANTSGSVTQIENKAPTAINLDSTQNLLPNTESKKFNNVQVKEKSAKHTLEPNVPQLMTPT